MREIHAATINMPTLYAGTSGFAYPAWKPEFYPEKMPSKKFLSYYSERLNAVEVNYTFRRLPSASTLEKWVAETRAGFVFPLKAHMRITHIQRLKPSEFTNVFFQAIDPLRSARRLGPVLFQLPPALKCDEALLAEVEKILELLKSNEHLKVQINGHTDNTGNVTMNKTLSLKRASSVVDYLISKGVDANRVSAKGFGSERPIVSNDDEEGGREINRRTEIEIISAG